MKISRTSMMSGVSRTLEIDVTQEQLDAWEDGALIQNVMPNLSPSEREFIITGIVDEEWDALYMDEENLDN